MEEPKIVTSGESGYYGEPSTTDESHLQKYHEMIRKIKHDPSNGVHVIPWGENDLYWVGFGPMRPYYPDPSSYGSAHINEMPKIIFKATASEDIQCGDAVIYDVQTKTVRKAIPDKEG